VKRILLVAVLLLCLMIVVVGAYFLISVRSIAAAPTLTQAVFPSETPTLVFTETASISPIITLTNSPTITPSATHTNTATPSPTPTLATRLFSVVVINPGVTLYLPSGTPAPTLTRTPLPTVNVPPPPPAADIARAAAVTLTPMGWVRYEDDDLPIVYSGKWEDYTKTYRATARRYRYSDDPTATATLRFVGAGVRVRYVLSPYGGVFELRIDGVTVTTVSTYLAVAKDAYGAFQSTEIFKLAHGWHTLELINTNRKENDSKGTVIALDAIEIYKSGLAPMDTPPLTPAPTATIAPTASPAPAKEIRLIAAPPMVLPTATPGQIRISVVIAYDENGNKAVDPNEGVSGVSVRLVRVDNNRVIASGITDARGYASLEALTDSALRVSIPYLGKFWDVPRTNGGQVNYTLLLPAANQPGLIP
jgi:hypothetical protein